MQRASIYRQINLALQIVLRVKSGTIVPAVLLRQTAVQSKDEAVVLEMQQQAALVKHPFLPVYARQDMVETPHQPVAAVQHVQLVAINQATGIRPALLLSLIHI